MNKYALAVIVGLVMVLSCFVVSGVIVIGDEVDASDSQTNGGYITNSDDNEGADSSNAIVKVGNNYFKSFKVAVDYAKNSTVNSDKTVEFVHDTYFTTTDSEKAIQYDVSGLTIDLCGHTVKVDKLAMNLVGKEFEITNGMLVGGDKGHASIWDSDKSATVDTGYVTYLLFIGDRTDGGDAVTDGVTISDISVAGGINVKKSTGVILQNLSVTSKNYYAVWCQDSSEVTINSGTYTLGGGVNFGVLNGTADSEMSVNGGTFIVPAKKTLVYSTGITPVFTGGFFYGDGLIKSDVEKYTPQGYNVAQVTGTLIYKVVKDDDDGSDDSIEIETETSKTVVEKTGETTSIVSEIKTDSVSDVNTAITETLVEIAKVQDATGSSSDSVTVQIVVPVSAEESTLELSGYTVTKLKESGAELTVSNSGMTVSLEASVIETLEKTTSASTEPLSIVVTPETTELTKAQKTIVGQNQAVDVSAFVGETKVSSLGGTAKISVPYQTDNKVKVTYVRDDGRTEDVDFTYVDGVVSFTTTHFSVFMISEISSVIIDPDDDYFPIYVPVQKTEATDSDDTAKIAVILGAITVVLVAIFAMTYRNR